MKEKRVKKRGAGAYPEQFRREAVRLVEAPEALAQIARDLDVHPDTLRSWCELVSGDIRRSVT